MDLKAAGIGRYLNEYLFYRACETYPQWKNTDPLRASQGRQARRLLDEALDRRGFTIDQAISGNAGVTAMLEAIDESLGQVWPDYAPMFPDAAAAGEKQKSYLKVKKAFGQYIGAGGSRPAGGVRLPVSPFDPRWADRETVLDQGTRMLSIPDDLVNSEVIDERGLGRLSDIGPDESFKLETLEIPEGWKFPRTVGQASTMADVTGMSALRPYMSESAYRELAPWVEAGAKNVDPSTGRQVGPMDAEALQRALAILDDFDEHGIDYTIEKDRNPGQLVARISGSKFSVRIADVGADSVWVGRCYDKGIATYFSNKPREGEGRYVPTPQEAVALVHFALGEPIERFDGRGTVGVPGQRDESKVRQEQSSYHVTDDALSMLEVRPGLWIRRNAKAVSQRTTWFGSEQEARDFLEQGVDSARESLHAALDVEGLIADFAANSFDPDYVPDFSGVEERLLVLKQEYWRMLEDPESGVLLLDPGFTRDDYQAWLDEHNGDVVGAQERYASAMLAATPAERVRRHGELVSAAMVGTFEPDPDDGKRFDPVIVSQYMSSGGNLWRNNDDVIEACRKAGIGAEELRGDEVANRAVADNLIEFDPGSAVDMREHPSPMVARLGERAAAAIERGAADVTSLEIDDNGVVRWSARRRVGTYDSMRIGADGKPAGWKKREVTGYFGQVLPRGEHGEVTTRFGGGEDFTFVPGFEASVVAQKPGEDLTLEQRTRLRGYEQSLGLAMEQTIARDIANPRSEVGKATSLNSVVRRMAVDRHPVGFFDALADPQVSEEDKSFLLAQADMGARRVRYPTAMGEGSNALAFRRAMTSEGFDPRNDNNRDWLIKTGLRNINELDRDAARGMFDPMATGTDGNQGLVRYLTPGAKLTPDGSIVPSDTPEARVGVVAHPYLGSIGYNPADRQIKAINDAARATKVDPKVRTALTQVGGWTYEDGIVVSQEFAERNSVTGADGAVRPLRVGDKLSDAANNKGVVSLVVDRWMSPEQAEALELSTPVQVFRDNPDLDVVMSPFSPISRFNGGTAREMMADPQDLVLRDPDTGEPYSVPGGTGELNMMITHLTVDKKTTVYDSEQLARGRGRKASGQGAWALQSQGAYEVLRQFYGENTTGLSDVREHLLVLGMDLDENGALLSEPSQDTMASRRLFEMVEPVRRTASANAKPGTLPSINHNAMNKAFGARIAEAGGMMEIPFELRLADGSTTPGSPLGNGNSALMVMSPSLRVEQDLVGGGVSRHDHTQRYINVFEQSNRYVEARRLRDEAAMDADSAKVVVHQKEMDDAQAAAQRAVDGIGKDVVARHVESKTNMFKESLMSARQPHSATAVWSPDPRLAVDQIAMNRDMAIELGVRMMNEELAEELGVPWTGVDPDPEDGYVLVWRDPVLRDGAMRYLRVVVDDELTGVAVNPVTVKSMDGDFDGDSVGLVGGLGTMAHLEAAERLTVEANLLDKGSWEEIPVYAENAEGVLEPTEETRRVRPLALHTGLDLEVACAADPELKPFLHSMVHEANDAAEAFERGDIDRTEFCDRSRAVLSGISGSFVRDGFENRRGVIALRFDSLDSHMDSVKSLYERGGKGSESKLLEYASYLGAEPTTETTGEGEQRLTGWRDTGMPDPEAFDEKYRGSEAAMAYKTQITGVAGSISQGAIRLLRAQGMVTEACELGYPVTQAVLQAKHDPVHAAYLADVVTGPAKDLWSGYELAREPDQNGRHRWSRVLDHEGRPVQASREKWVDQFMHMYADAEGMNVAVDQSKVDKVSRALSDERGKMLDTSRQNWDRLPEDRKPLVLDKLAYGGKFEDLVAAATERGRLFAGPNASFAPKTVMSNEAVRRELESMGITDYQGRTVGEAVEQAVPQRADTTVGYAKRLPRSEWTSRLPGWTGAARTAADRFVRPKTAPVPESVGVAVSASPGLPASAVALAERVSEKGSSLRQRLEEGLAEMSTATPAGTQFGG